MKKIVNLYSDKGFEEMLAIVRAATIKEGYSEVLTSDTTKQWKCQWML